MRRKNNRTMITSVFSIKYITFYSVYKILLQ
jgi:hypothetical protein